MLLPKKLLELAFYIYNFLHKIGPRFLEELEKKQVEFVIFVIK